VSCVPARQCSFQSSLFEGNEVIEDPGLGGAFYSSQAVNVTFSDCVVTGNKVSGLDMGASYLPGAWDLGVVDCLGLTALVPEK
jgi:hypothetical protein